MADDRTTRLARALWARAQPTLAFLGAFTVLSAILDVRYPGAEPSFWYLLPAIDVVVLLTMLSVIAWRGLRLPRTARIALVAWFMCVRFLRLGDGIEQRFLYRDFNLYVDLQLIPELVRLYYVTVPLYQFLLSLLALLAAVAALAVVAYRALLLCERYLATAARARVLLAVAAALAVASPFVGSNALRLGAFGASSLPRILREVAFFANVNEYRAATLKRIARVERDLARLPSNLAKLERANVYLFVIESYGQTATMRSVFASRMRSVHARFEAELAQRGFVAASSLLDSPTYGGGSWLAQATLATGIRASNQFEYELICQTKPKAIARYFREAGYRTILVQPATTRRWPDGDFYGFDRKYFAWDFDYRGPAFAWAPMPDQYVLDFVRRSEQDFAGGPAFVEYTLVSSHAPWNRQPPLVDDWSKLGNGAIYGRLEVVRYPVTWSDLSRASDAYIRSLEYDFEVLRRYVGEFIRDESLVVVLGDHQPPAEVTEQNASRGVPIHVLSRRRSLVDDFVAAGYTRGMRPAATGKKVGMDRFLPTFLERLSAVHTSQGGTRR